MTSDVGTQGKRANARGWRGAPESRGPMGWLGDLVLACRAAAFLPQPHSTLLLLKPSLSSWVSAGQRPPGPDLQGRLTPNPVLGQGSLKAHRFPAGGGRFPCQEMRQTPQMILKTVVYRHLQSC